jgi:nitrogen regulatory protein P-II 1|tara:strand:- start:1866 stop:2249 length:384 start_codon:yes stop_codon:yes gene_type:complete
MKRAGAIFKPFKQGDVKEMFGVVGVTVVDGVEGFGRQDGHTEICCGRKYTMGFSPKLKLELVVADEKVAITMKLIQVVANTCHLATVKFLSHQKKISRVSVQEKSGGTFCEFRDRLLSFSYVFGVNV